MKYLFSYKAKPLATAVLIVLTGVAAAQAREAVVTTIDGGRFAGKVLVDNESGITLVYSGIKVPIPRNQIKYVKYLETIEQQYAQRRAAIEDENVDKRYLLAYWLFENKAYKLAKQELDSLKTAFPNDPRIDRLGSIVSARIKLLQKPPQPTNGDQKTSPSLATSSSVGPTTSSRPMLTAEQINLIKVYEIDLSKKPTVVVPRQVIEEVLTDYANHPAVPTDKRQRAALRKAPGYEQLELLFDLKARSLYSKTRVIGDPTTMREFRTKIHQRYVLSYCGTVACHGRADTDGFALARLRPNSEATVYTNFYTLHSTTINGQEVIDRQEPNRSLLLQYGMAPANTQTPHPEVAGWRPRFHNAQDQLYSLIGTWINSLWTPTPDYGIEPNPQPDQDPQDETPPPDSHTPNEG